MSWIWRGSSASFWRSLGAANPPFAKTEWPFDKTLLRGRLGRGDGGAFGCRATAKGNRHNGKVTKQLRTLDGVIEVITSPDRLAGFEPQIIRKQEIVLAENLEPRILSLYGLGMNLRDISSHLMELYDMDISHDTLANLTEKIMVQVTKWQARPLGRPYCVV